MTATSGEDALNEMLKQVNEGSAGQTTIEKLCLETPLYTPVQLTDKKTMALLRTGSFQFDGHCVQCNKDTTFRTMRSTGGGAAGSRGVGAAPDVEWMLRAGDISVEVYCQRIRSHSYEFLFRYRDGVLVKYGQLPSLEDIASADLKKYAGLMPKGYFAELKRAGGLASHGIGIGSFVYLRRIFEKLIRDHYDAVKAERPVEGFETLRVEDKIAALKDVLPSALVENKAAYGILSAGIHELDEDTCRRYFPVVREAIVAILEQDLQARQKEEQASKLRNAIAGIAGEVKASKAGET